VPTATPSMTARGANIDWIGPACLRGVIAR
jgi:hypothetical protein